MRVLRETGRFGVVYLACVLVSAGVYLRAADNSFRQDDLVFLRHSETTPVRHLLDPTPDFAFYRPGAITLFALEHRLFGRAHQAYIGLNVLLHLLSSGLVLLVLRRIGLGMRASLLGSSFFVVGVGHYGKQVMWACASGPLMGVLLGLVAVLLTLEWLRATPRGGRWVDTKYGVLVALLLTVSPSYHESALVCSVLGWIVVRLSLRSGAGRIRYVWPFLFPVVVGAAVVITMSDAYPAYRVPATALLNVPESFVRYLGFMVIPLQQTSIVSGGKLAAQAAAVAQLLHVPLGLGITLFLARLIVRGSLRSRILAAWTLIAMLPAAFVSLPESWHELRYLYPVSIPFCGLFALGVEEVELRGKWAMKNVARLVVVCAIVGSVVMALLLERRYDRDTTESAVGERLVPSRCKSVL